MKKTLFFVIGIGFQVLATCALAQEYPDIVDEATVTPLNSLALAPSPTNAELTARKYQTFLTQINKPYANQLGTFNGRGVTVGVADTGVEANHPELKGKIAQAYNAIDGSANVQDTVGHGTHVSGLIAGSLANGALLEGVAPGAAIAMAKVFGNSGTTNTSIINTGINWLVNTAKTPIVSLSLGSASAFDSNALLNGVKKDILFTVASGNEAQKTVSWPARYAKETWANGQIIVVGAVDATNKLASFSNYGADTAAWYVVAPGVSIASSYINGSYVYMSGTSMATPIVAGQAALIKSEWSFLTAPQLAQIIFKSATRLGKATDTTPDPIYGWGLINVAKSMSPLGPVLAVTATGGKTVNIGMAALVTTTGTIKTKSLSMTGVDDFGRGFNVDVAKGVTSQSSSPIGFSDLYASMNRQDALVDRVEGPARMAMKFTRDYAGKVTLEAMAFSQTATNGMTLGFGTGSTSDKFFGLQASGLAPQGLTDDSKFNAPYFNLVKGAMHVGSSFALNDNTKIRFGGLSESSTFAYKNGQQLDRSSLADRTLASAEIEHRSGNALGIVSFGVMQERGSVLGSISSDAYAFSARPRTAFTSLSGGYSFSSRLSLAAIASYGVTSGFNNSDSLVTRASSARTASYSLGLSAKDVWNGDNRIGLSFSMPTKIISGDMTLSGAVSQNLDGSLNTGSQVMYLRPEATEHDLELTYSTVAGKEGKFLAAAMLRMNPGHDAASPRDVVLGVRYSRPL